MKVSFRMFHVDPQTTFRVKTASGNVSLKAVNNLLESVKRDIRDRVEVLDIDLWIDSVVTVLLAAERADVITDGKLDYLIETVIIPSRDLVRRYRGQINYHYNQIQSETPGE